MFRATRMVYLFNPCMSPLNVKDIPVKSSGNHPRKNQVNGCFSIYTFERQFVFIVNNILTDNSSSWFSMIFDIDTKVIKKADSGMSYFPHKMRKGLDNIDFFVNGILVTRLTGSRMKTFVNVWEMDTDCFSFSGRISINPENTVRRRQCMSSVDHLEYFAKPMDLVRFGQLDDEEKHRTIHQALYIERDLFFSKMGRQRVFAFQRFDQIAAIYHVTTMRLDHDTPECDGCQERTLPLKKCSGCNAATYCSVVCQKSDWKKHKKKCSKDLIHQSKKEFERMDNSDREFAAADSPQKILDYWDDIARKEGHDSSFSPEIRKHYLERTKNYDTELTSTERKQYLERELLFVELTSAEQERKS